LKIAADSECIASVMHVKYTDAVPRDVHDDFRQCFEPNFPASLTEIS